MRIALPAEPLIDGPTALRPWRDADVPDLARAARDPEIARWTRVPDKYGETDARAFLLQRLDHLAAGTMAPFAIVAAEGGRLLGSISLTRLSERHRRAEIGYWLGAGARGQGHTTRATRLLCAWAQRALGIERFGLLTATGNTASQAVAERCGFTREAVLRSHTAGKAGRFDMVAFGLLPSAPR